MLLKITQYIMNDPYTMPTMQQIRYEGRRGGKIHDSLPCSDGVVSQAWLFWE
jgi:hypothetical protein